MQRKGSRIGKSLIGRLAVSILAIWVPFSVVVIIGMVVLSNRITEETIDNQTDKVKYYSAIINADIARVIQSTNQLCANKFIVDFTGAWKGTMESGYYRLYYDAYRTLKEYRDTSICIDDIFIYLPYAGEVLSANQSIITEDGIYRTMREEYMEKEQNFFHDGDALYYLSQSSNEMVTGIKVSLKDIRYTLKDYDSEGSYDYFFVNALTKELLDAEENIGDVGKMIYAGMDWNRKGAQEIRIGRRKYLVDRIGKDANGFLILIYMDKSEAYANIYDLYKIWGVATLLLLLVPVVLGLRVRRIVNRPMEKLQKAMQMVERENYGYLLAMDESREFNYVFAQYNQMTEKVRNLIQEVLEKQVQVEQARYKQLQTQINPHFLFNSLYMGYRLAQSENCEAVGDLCMYLGDYFSVLTFVSNESISMEYELKFVNTYLCLNRMRFGAKLSYEVEVQEGLEEDRLPPLLLQPLIENSISHGLEKCSHHCLIRVEIGKKEDRLHFVVEDDSNVMTQETMGELRQAINREKMPVKNFGLWNIQSRLKTWEEGNPGILMEKKGKVFRVSFSIRVSGTDGKTVQGAEDGSDNDNRES